MSEDRMAKVKADLNQWLVDQNNHIDFAPSYEEYANELIRLLKIEAAKEEVDLHLTIRRLELKCKMLEERSLKLVEALKKYEACICDDGETYAAREALEDFILDQEK